MHVDGVATTRCNHIINPAIQTMNGDRKFLAVIGLTLSLLIVFRVAPCATAGLLALLLAMAYFVVALRRHR
jgi:hypothetical protein